MAENYTTRQERRKQNEAQKKGKPKKGGLFKRIFLVLVTIGIIGIIAGGATFAYFISDAPKLDEKLLKDPVSSKILYGDGELLTRVELERRDFVAYEDIPKKVENAVLATEDVRFYEHHGIDALRLGKAVLANFTDGFGSQGASTLTQQVVKRSYLTADKTVKRKVQEMWLAFQLEQKYTKQEIFEMYVNKIFFSERANGIATASKVYYGKELKDLKMNEIAMLVGLPQSPNRYNPYEHPDRAKERRDVVLYLMNRHGFISKAEMEKSQNVSIAEGLVKKETKKDMSTYDAFIDQVIEEVESMGDYNVYTDGLEIHTTLDRDAQEYVYKMLNTEEVIKYPSEKLQAGITLLDTKTGEIRAIGGGRNTKVSRGFNYAVDSKRQPGSTIKPILDYGPAVEYLNWSSSQQITDEEYEYTNGTPLKNASNRYYGSMSIREALGRSLNIPAVKTIQAVGLDRARDFASNLGIPLPEEIHEAYAIGGITNGISSLQLAGAYSAFGNGGKYIKPHTVKKIVLRDKTTVKNQVQPKAVMKDSTAFIISDMLKSVLNESYGTGRLANVSGLPIAGKTGSTNFEEEDRLKYNIPAEGVPDSWMAGYTTNYTVAVWAGYDTEKDKKEYLGTESQKIPKYLFKNLMEYVSQDVVTKDFKQPDSVFASSGEYYVKGHQPITVAKKNNKPVKKRSEPVAEPAVTPETIEEDKKDEETDDSKVKPPEQEKEPNKEDENNGEGDNDDQNGNENSNGNGSGPDGNGNSNDPENGTDDGSADDEKPDDGSADDDGTPDDGSADDVKPDDGSAGGGTPPNDGSADDGTPDDGSTNDGTPDDGSTDDGSRENGLGAGNNGNSNDSKNPGKTQPPPTGQEQVKPKEPKVKKESKPVESANP
ncbi:PBP1A family penicillin-binding protein [Peribacillus cavernae]|uniref:PBP1A family penicillin-binding protein n=1 Tax=Peribacillus cavernae TaxID=1674310 RepID=A0A3S0TYT4_9BACI|nr:PBP1A family penicillin-binding protein [Peribacillus cavernae]MDQ0216938.1 penicillin-binding protein 1A [Peribacillus cavernae]RUQ30569.1 PBP1A family penicillin-binding protein [Peribacillus cavernae]